MNTAHRDFQTQSPLLPATSSTWEPVPPKDSYLFLLHLTTEGTPQCQLETLNPTLPACHCWRSIQFFCGTFNAFPVISVLRVTQFSFPGFLSFPWFPFLSFPFLAFLIQLQHSLLTSLFVDVLTLETSAPEATLPRGQHGGLFCSISI